MSPRLYEFKSKCVLRLKPNAAEFLKQYSTNIPEAPRSAFIDLKGRIVTVNDQQLLNKDEALIAIERVFVERLKKHLTQYLFLLDAALTEEKMSVYFDLNAGKIIFSKDALTAGVSEQEFTLYRLKAALPLQGVDFDDELLLNVMDEEVVSYTKGCYLGQEIIARVHHRSKPPKKLVVRAEAECSLEQRIRLTSCTRDPETGIRSGFIFVDNDGPES